MPILTISLKGKELVGRKTIILKEALNVHHFKLLHIHHNISSKTFTDRTGVISPAQNTKAQRLFYVDFNFMNLGDVSYNIQNEETNGYVTNHSLNLINLGLTSHSSGGEIMSRDLYKQLASKAREIPRDLKYQLFFKDAYGEIQELTATDLTVSGAEVNFIDFVFEYDLV